jgi:hypothetical protein
MPPIPPRSRTGAGIRGYWRRVTATQSELDLRFGRPVVDGDRATVEWWAIMNDPQWGRPTCRKQPRCTEPRLRL